MGLIGVRRFDVATYVADHGDLAVAGISRPHAVTWDINLAQVIGVNALAVPADRQVTFQVMQNELRILTSFLSDVPGKRLTMLRKEFRASASHIKRFLSESVGLGMLTAVTERHYGWNLDEKNLAHFDVLPSKLASQYPGVGIRPDLLFDFASQGHEDRLAGESRGRSGKSPGEPNKDQRRRLDQIVAWSGWNDFHPVTMAYTYTGAESVQVDLFHVATPDELKADLNLFERPSPLTVTTSYESAQSLRPQALGRVSEVEGQLYATAPPSAPGARRAVFDREVRGSWATADLVAQSNLRFFLGVLNAPLNREQAGAARRLRTRQEDREADPIQVATTGRIVVAVARDASANPDWSEVTDRIED